jgi:hypothetical protein
MLLTIMVLTSDDVYFESGLTAPIPGEDETPILEAYAKASEAAAAAGAGARPALILSYMPLLLNAGGDFLVNTMSKASGGVPNFGTIIVDNTADYSSSRSFYNGEAFADRYAFVLLYGDVTPKFYQATLPAERIFREKGIVTDATGNQIKSVNGMLVGEYLLSLGLTKDENDQFVGVNSYPFVVDYNDGTDPVIRILFAITPEGYAVCGGDVPVGATLSVGNMDGNDIVRATTGTLDEIAGAENPDVLILFSCIGRYLAMGYEPYREISAVHEALDGKGLNYIFAYSGGEICPAHGGADESTVNHFHNLTFTACAF